MSKLYIGFDLGDGESIVEILTPAQNVETGNIVHITGIKMPTSNVAGKAIPTAYAIDNNGKACFWDMILFGADTVRDVFINFKRRPSDLIGSISPERELDITSALKKSNTATFRQFPELDNDKLKKFAESVITFTNMVFTNNKFLGVVQSCKVGCDSVVFAVGHPTKWNDFDVAVYKSILSESVLGKDSYEGMSSKLIMAAESRAAFLYLKSQQISAKLEKGESAMLIDIGSSTIDVTAMSGTSKTHDYNYGSNYLGARSIDYMLREYYLENLKANTADWVEYNQLVKNNPQLKTALTLSCRIAKEKLFTGTVGKERIDFLNFRPVNISIDDVKECAEKFPIANILKIYANLPEEEIENLGNMSWTQAFAQFLKECRQGMNEKGLRVGRIIMTGSASQMTFVREIIEKEFSEIPNVLLDPDPPRSISQGLALVGPSDERSEKFQKELQMFIDEKLPKIVEENISALGEELSEEIAPEVERIVKRRLREWRDGKIKTLNEMKDIIKRDCESKEFADKFSQSKSYKNKIGKWLSENVGKSIASDLKGLCNKYGAKEISLEDLNVMTLPGGGTLPPIDPTSLADLIVKIVGIVVAIVAIVVLPSVIWAILLAISVFSVTIAAWILTALQAIPGVGIAILVAVLGKAVYELVTNGAEGAKEKAVELIQNANLPEFARKLLTDKKIDEKIIEMNIRETIIEAFDKPETKNSFKEEVCKSLANQVEKRAEDIKYIIESK